MKKPPHFHVRAVDDKGEKILYNSGNSKKKREKEVHFSKKKKKTADKISKKPQNGAQNVEKRGEGWGEGLSPQSIAEQSKDKAKQSLSECVERAAARGAPTRREKGRREKRGKAKKLTQQAKNTQKRYGTKQSAACRRRARSLGKRGQNPSYFLHPLAKNGFWVYNVCCIFIISKH